MMNEFKFNKTYSSLKESYLILYKELSVMKKKNEQLKQRVKELETSNQHMLTKEEMKEMIKEGLTPITNALLGKERETVNVGIQTEKIIKDKKKVQKITIIEKVMQSEELDTTNFGVTSLIETKDKRIASGGQDGNISISSYDLNKKTWKIDIHKEKAHGYWVKCLCILNGNRLLSGGHDKLIKIWTISKRDITLIKEIKEHTQAVNWIIPLSKERFTSGSFDCTIKIWKDNNSYECLSTLIHNECISSILQLRGKEVLVSSGFKGLFGVTFWNLNNYTKLHAIKGYDVRWPTHMIELFDGNIALSTWNYPCLIVIIDNSTYQVKKEIKFGPMKEWSLGSAAPCFSLHVFDKHSFFFVRDGYFVQISNEDGSILFQSKGGRFDGYYGVIPLEGGEYFALNNDKGIAIIKPCYV